MDIKIKRPEFDHQDGSSSNQPPKQRHWMLADHEQVLKLWRGFGFDDVADTGDSLTFTTNRGKPTESRIVVTPDEVTYFGYASLSPADRHQAHLAGIAHAKDQWGGAMKIWGSESYKLRDWAYAEVLGVTVTNYQPSPEQAAAARAMLAEVRGLLASHTPVPPVHGVAQNATNPRIKVALARTPLRL